VAYSAEFDTELLFSPREEGGYLFALTLLPRFPLPLSPLRQHYLFLIDRSNSIQQARLAATKSALRKALEELHSQDTFNIIAFDHKVEKLSSVPLAPTPQALEKAEHFLNELELGSFFAQTDLCKPLFVSVPVAVDDQELHTAILMTDGESLARADMAQQLFEEWTRYNQGKLTLHTLTLQGDPHAALLHAASALNRGISLAAPTAKGLKRRLLKLMKMIQAPLIKNLSCRIVSPTGSSAPTLFANANFTPHLYLNEPYVLLGQCDHLDDFVLCVQGHLHEEWIHIKKKISFLDAKKGNISLKKEWALQKTYCLYQQYLRDENVDHIAQAEKLIEAHHLSGTWFKSWPLRQVE
jgi:hypothetical protein